MAWIWELLARLMGWIWNMLSMLPFYNAVSHPILEEDVASLRNVLSRLPTDIRERVILSARAIPSTAESEGGSLRLRAMNDYVHEVEGSCRSRPSVELVFFHGLQPRRSEESQQPHVDAWLSQDGSELWLNWIFEKFPQARIFVISYDAHTHKTTTDGRMDMYVTTENLLECLTGGAQVGQSKCPVILVGHCIGGIVMKELCVFASNKVGLTCEERTQPVQKFLHNLKGLFFYATPHHGTRLAESNTVFQKARLFAESAPLNEVTTRRNEHFRTLCRKNGWRTYGIGETNEVTLGRFKGVIVQEASARCDVEGFYTAPDTDHFDVSRPTSRVSSNYTLLIDFVSDMTKKVERKIHDEEPVHKCTGLPIQHVGLKRRAENVQELLKGGGILGIFGMGGIGKSTLARQVFNNLSQEFDYTCFIDTAKQYSHNSDLQKVVLDSFYFKGIKQDGTKTQWSQMNGMKTCIVMDDPASEHQLAVLPPWEHFGQGSCLIITSRNRKIFNFSENCIVHQLEFLDTDEAKTLFCKHAFGSQEIPRKWEHLRDNVVSVVTKCGGLPLSLEVMGRYLRKQESQAVWEETIDNLQNALPIDGGQSDEDRLWATLELSYKKLSNEAQDLFRDAATFFLGERVDKICAVWSDRKAETTWRNLVDRAMVKEVTMSSYKRSTTGSHFILVQREVVWVHEHLQDLAKKLEKHPTLDSAHQEVNSVVAQLNAERVNTNTKGLRLKNPCTFNSPRLQVDCLLRLEQLKYVHMDGVLLEGEGKRLPQNLRLLQFGLDDSAVNLPYRRDSWQFSLMNIPYLAVLEFNNCVIREDFPEASVSLVNLRILILKYCIIPAGFHEALGNLKNLCSLQLTGLTGQMTSPIPPRLPESFGQLTNLEDIIIRCYQLQFLPDSFGCLKAARKVFLDYPKLERLPDGFGRLSSLENLQLACEQLKSLSDDFGQLVTLKNLGIWCSELKTLPDSFVSLQGVQKVVLSCPKLERLPDGFGRLSSLETLQLWCEQLKSLSDDFGQLVTLKDLQIGCSELKTLPDSFLSLQGVQKVVLRCPKLEGLLEGFGRLSSLEILQLWCERLKSLADDFGQLATLKKLEIWSDELEMLPDSFGALQGVDTVVLHCPKLERLPEGFGRLSSLENLQLWCEQLKSLSDDFGQLVTLKDVQIGCDELKTLPDSFVSLQGVQKVVLRCPELERLPEGFGRLSSLETLDLDSKGLKSLSDDFGQLATLKDLQIRCDELKTLPDSFVSLQGVQKVVLRCPELERLPEGFGRLSSLETLDLDLKGLKSLSDDFGQLATLKDLQIRCDELKTLPDSFVSLQAVQKVVLSCPKLEQLPEGFGRLSSLETLQLWCEQLKSLSDDFGQLVTLKDLQIGCSELKTLPDSFVSLQGVQKVVLRCPKLERLPKGFGRLSSLETLDLDSKGLKSLSDDFGQLVTLKHLQIGCDELQTLPDSFVSLQGVQKVVLRCPELERLPEGFGRLSSLETLDLDSKGLKSLSDDFGQLATLKDLQIRCSELKMLPDSFVSLQGVQKVVFDCPKLEQLPEGFGRLSSLETLELDCQQLKSLSDDFGQLATLKDLQIRCSELKTLPDSFGSLKGVQKVVLDCPKLERLPEGFGS